MASTIDFRHLDEGFGGKTYKRKREQAQAVEDAKMEEIHAMEMETDETAPPPAKRSALPSESDPNKPSFSSFSFGKPTYDGVIAGRVSGRNWKQVRQRRSSAMQVSKKGTTFEERTRAKSIKAAFKERMTELKEEIRLNKVEKRKKKEEREKKKKENILRTGTKLQKITNPKTLKRIAKSKQRKQLRMVPDDSFKLQFSQIRHNAVSNSTYRSCSSGVLTGLNAREPTGIALSTVPARGVIEMPHTGLIIIQDEDQSLYKMKIEAYRYPPRP